MAVNLVLRYLVLWTITCALFRASEIQAQTTPVSVSSSSSSLSSSFLSSSNSSANLSISTSTPSVFLTSPSQNQSSPSQNQSSPSQNQSSSSPPLSPLSTSLIVTPANTVDPTFSQPRSTVKQSTTMKPTTDSKDELKLTITEYILIACLGVFIIVLIIIIIMVVQLANLNKTVNNLKFAPSS